MRSPFANCELIPFTEERTEKFRNEDFCFTFRALKCPKTGEVLTTTELDEVNLSQVYNQYRAKHNIPFVDEIQGIRKYYGVSAQKMAAILGLGSNQYRLYENGEMPSIAIGKLLRAIQTPSVFISYVKMCDQLSDKEKKEFTGKAKNRNIDDFTPFLHLEIFGNQPRDVFNGYAPQSLSKVKNMMLFFIEKNEELFQTKMNKLLFYADFLCYKITGRGMSGLSYIALQYGPVPYNWNKVFSLTEDIKQEVILLSNGSEGHILISDLSPDKKAFTEKEIEVLECVNTTFRNVTASSISETSHKEKAWIDNVKNHNFINYSYAFQLSI